MEPGFVRENWPEIKKIPGWLWFTIIFAFLTLLLAGVGVTWRIAESVHAATVQAKDATLVQKDATIEQLQSRLEYVTSQKEELRQASDSQKVQYAATATALSRISNAELQKRALELAKKIFDLAAEWRNDYSYNYRTVPQSREDFWKEAEESSRRSGERMNRYNQEIRTDAIILRDEILSRLTQAERDAHTVTGHDPYQLPVNSFGLDEVAMHLQRVAKLLDVSR